MTTATLNGERHTQGWWEANRAYRALSLMARQCRRNGKVNLAATYESAAARSLVERDRLV